MNSARISMITLAVEDLQQAKEFYGKLGWVEAEGGTEDIAFYKLPGQYFALYSRDALTRDLCLPIHGRTTGGVTLATNFEDRAAVDAAFEIAIAAGAHKICAPKETLWGGYSGYFADADSHLWELAHNPFWTLDQDGHIVDTPS